MSPNNDSLIQKIEFIDRHNKLSFDHHFTDFSTTVSKKKKSPAKSRWSSVMAKPADLSGEIDPKVSLSNRQSRVKNGLNLIQPRASQPLVSTMDRSILKEYPEALTE